MNLYRFSLGPRLTSHPWKTCGATNTPFPLATLDPCSTRGALRKAHMKSFSPKHNVYIYLQLGGTKKSKKSHFTLTLLQNRLKIATATKVTVPFKRCHLWHFSINEWLPHKIWDIKDKSNPVYWLLHCLLQSEPLGWIWWEVLLAMKKCRIHVALLKWWYF